MNKTRRKEIGNVITEVEILQDSLESVDETTLITEGNLGRIFDITCLVDSIKSEEEEYRDNMPENLQNSERYYAADEACSNLDSALDLLQGFDDTTTVDECIESLNEVISHLNDAAQ